MKKYLKHIIIISIVFFLLLTACIRWPQKEKIYRIGILWAGGDAFSGIVDSFKTEMTKLGYHEGKNITYEIYKAPEVVGNEDAIQKFVDDEVDLILTFPTEASLEAKTVAEGSGIPIVFTCAFIEETGLVERVDNPGGSITGVRYPTTEGAIGRLEYLHEVVPEAKRIWMPYMKDYPTIAPQIQAISPLASEYNLTLIAMPFVTPVEVRDYLDSLDPLDDIGMDAIMMMVDPFAIIFEVYDEVYKFADEHNLPISSYKILDDTYGPIISFHPSNNEMGSLAATQVDKVLKGIPAGNMPVFTSENKLGINFMQIQHLGLNVSEGLLVRADKIIG